MSATVGRSESVDNTCPVCHDVIDMFAIGQCDHPVCSRCSTRMRVLCEQMDCPICRSPMPQVAFVYNKSFFKDISLRECIPNRKYKIFFEDKDVEDSFLELLDYRCRMPSCQNRNSDKSFAQLQTHMRREHQLFACDLCVSHLRIFPFERKFYNRKDLATHRRVGDEDDKSYKGHPLCEFCDARYNDKDELLKHLRKDHYFCHFCDQHGSNAYYDQYHDLMKHFSENHFLCTEGECGNSSTRFTHAFTSEIDFKAHRASAHNQHLSKAQSREARTIEVDFQTSRRRPGQNRGDDYEDTRPSQRGRGGDRYHRRRDYDPEDADLHRAIEASKELSHTETAPAFEERVPDPVADFPALNGTVMPVSTPLVQKPARAPEEDFPTLSATRSNKHLTQPPVKAYSSVMNRQVDTKPTIPVQKESKPVSLGSVSKMLREHPSLAPKNTEDEYPSLGGSMSTAQNLVSNTGSGNWVTKSQNKNIVANSGIAVNAKKEVNNKSTNLRHVDTFMRDENQFPSLSTGGQLKNSGVFAQQSVSSGMFAQQSKSSGVFAQSFPDWSKQNGSSKKKQKAEKSYDQSFELPESYHKSFEDSSSVEKTVNVVKTLPGATAVAVDKRSKPASINNSEEFPGLPVRIDNVRTKEESKKKKKMKKEEKVKSKVSDNTNACLGEIALALMQPEKESDHIKNNLASYENKTNNNKRANKLLDWFDNPPDVAQDSQPRTNATYENVASKKNDQSFLPVEDSSSSDSFLNENSSNFPSLHAMSISIQQPKPPPGFTSYPQPPSASYPQPPSASYPQSPSVTLVSAPPGFGNQSPSFSAIPSTPPGFPVNVAYIQPADFKTRNLKLIEDIREALVTVYDGFPNFKVLSSQFRQCLMDASDYYVSCQSLMGDEKFTKVFPELLALLPDISKQRELWQIHQAVTKKAATASSNKLSDCQVCGQVMMAQDVYHHQLQHASSSNFPLFGDSTISSSNGVGSDMQIKEACIKAK